MACSPKRTGHDEELKFGLPELVSRILLELRIRFDLCLRDWHEDLEGRERCLRVPCSRSVLPEADQVLTALALRSELEETLVENRVAHRLLRLPGRDRLRCAEDARANQVDIRNRRRGLSQLVLRFGSDQVHLAETEEGVVVPVVLLHV